MRLRNVPGARDVIAESRFTIKNETEYKGRWNTVFGNDHPVYIEIGMGKGQFILTLAAKNPDINYIGIEKYSSVLIRAIEKQEEEALPNLFFIRMEAENIADVFAEGEVAGIYLNFSDPWPKDRHAKRRLTSRQFLERYEKILDKKGRVVFKTDNRELFDFSLEQVEEASHWMLLNHTFDLHHSEYVNGNIMTEYETRFVEKGNAICRMEIMQTQEEAENDLPV
ncbi:MAG: tRNA (guanosine(46)-N7)-methyltransferase TrmB [Bacteroidales bacterium]|nr:tRNA (guanosine(46)-N7)-methyltransferase TrmB [Clostridium sp.]MCM1204301.1 tRNA (guanosine(46)-N7)-methyltransferase TrmB [Bacteroidales bacterium]